jgi:hypothetical protein
VTRWVGPALLVMAVAGAPGAAAQRVMGGAPLDSAQMRQRDRLLALRDTVRTVSAAVVGFRRDLTSAGSETVVFKARRLVQACGPVRTAMLDAVPGFGRREVPAWAGPAADSLQSALRGLGVALDQHCLSGLAPTGPGERADSLRAWGPYRTAQLRLAIDRLHSSMSRFADACRFKLPPASPR